MNKENLIHPSRIDLYVHIHATESEDKVLKAIANIIGELERFKIRREEYTGHHGNPIIRLEISIRDKRSVKQIFENIFRRIRGYIEDKWIVERYDKKNRKLYLRLDKQKAYMGELQLGYGDDIIKIIFSFPGYLKLRPDELEKYINELRNKPSA